MRFISQRGSVDDEVDVFEFALECIVFPGNSNEALVGALEAFFLEVRLQLGGESGGFFGGAIDENEALAVLDGALDGHRFAGTAAGAENKDAQVAEIDGEFVANGAEEARAVAVESDELSSIDDDGVDRADFSCEIVHFIHRFEGARLVRDRDVGAEEALLRKEAQGVLKFARLDMETNVLAIDSGGGESGIVELGGERVFGPDRRRRRGGRAG